MKDKKYTLVNTMPFRVIKDGYTMNERAADTLNYAYSLNGVKRKYIESSNPILKHYHSRDEKALAHFKKQTTK